MLWRVDVTFVSVHTEVASDPQAQILANSIWPSLMASTGGGCSEAAALNDDAAVVRSVDGSSSPSPPPTPPLATTVRDDVFRYLQTKDRYAALVSVLLKSRAFHRSRRAVAGEEDEDIEDEVLRRHALPIVRLPRTGHNKPYLPTPYHRPINVSHQHPFVGIAELSSSCANNHFLPLSNNLQIGLDIVVFDDYNRSLYASTRDFVNVFYDNFTPSEWTLLSSLDNVRLLREFYLRWAIKEAYTKALGVGLGYNFASLQVQLLELPPEECQYGGNEADEEWPPSSLSDGRYYDSFQRTLSDCGAPRLLPATVLLLSEGREESWWFAFVPLNLPEMKDERPTTFFDGGALANGDDNDNDNWPRGCACVCVGPRPSSVANNDDDDDDASPHKDDIASWPFHVKWRTLQDLIDYHTGCRTTSQRLTNTSTPCA